MAREVHRGEIWMFAFAPPNKTRPVLVLSSNDILSLRLRQVLVAEISSTLHDSPAEVVLGLEDGMKQTCAVNLINLSTVPMALLIQYRGSLSTEKMRQVCVALAVVTGC